MKTKISFSDTILLLLLLVIVCLAALYFYPYAMEIPHRDSGIYLYLGSELVKGKTIYVDVWEHKPPFIFFVNALGLLLGGGSPWGVWGLEVAFLFLTLLLGYLTARRVLKPLPGFLVTAAAFLATFQFISGNFTEEYMLLFQALMVFLFLGRRKWKDHWFLYCLIGISAGFSFNFKQTYIDVAAAISIFLIFEALLKKKRENWLNLLWMACGFLATNLLVVVVMAISGALEAWWNTAYGFNFAYSDIGMTERLYSLFEGIKNNLQYPFFGLLLLAWVCGLFILVIINWAKLGRFFKTKFARYLALALAVSFLGLLVVEQFLPMNNPGLGLVESAVLILAMLCFLLFLFLLPAVRGRIGRLGMKTEADRQKEIKADHGQLPEAFILGIINLPIALVLISTSGRNYPHYFITLFPAIFLLFLGTCTLLVGRFTGKTGKIITAIILIGLFTWAAIKPVQKIARGVGGPYAYNPYREAIQYIKDNSTGEDTLVVWSMESGINYLAGLSAPSRFSYVDPLYFTSPFKAEAQEIFYRDITTKPPLFILDLDNPDYPFIDGRNKTECLAEYPEDGSYLNKTIRHICENYALVDQKDGIDIYRLQKQAIH